MATDPILTPMEQLLGSSVFTNTMSAVPVSQLQEKDYVLLYFGSSWCPPCKTFTPVLAQFYNNHSKTKNFEVVFVSLDRDEASFRSYIQHHPWLAVAGIEAHNLSKQLKVSGTPAVQVFDAKTGEIITREGRVSVVDDANALRFPWPRGEIK